MGFEYTKTEKKQMLNSIKDKEAIISGLEVQKARAKNSRDKATYDREITRLKNEIQGLRSYMR